MLRGENVGTAYVRIIADGSGLDPSIRKAFDDSEPSVREGARQHGDAYDAEFQKQLRKSFKGNFGKTQKDMFEDLDRSLVESMSRLELSDRFFKSAGWKKFRNRLEAEGGPAGELFARRLAQRFRDSGNLEGLAQAIKGAGPEMRKAQRDILNEIHVEALSMNKAFDAKQLKQQRDMLDEAYRLNKAYDARILKERLDLDKQFDLAHKARVEADRDMYAEAYQMNRDFTLKAAALRKKQADQERNDIRDIRTRYSDLLFQIDRMKKGLSVTASRRDLAKELESVSTEMGRLGMVTRETHYALRDHERDLHLMHPTLNKFNRLIDEGADGFGRMFGKGSRNNFLNFIGSMADGLFRITKILPNSIAMMRDFFARASLAGKRGGPLAFFGSMAGDVLKLSGAIAGGLGAAFGIVGPMISILSELAGVVVALASNLGFALVGASGSAAGALLPLVAGLAAAGFGFANLEGDAKKAAKGVVDEFKDLGKVAAEGLTFAGRTGDALSFDTRPFETQMNIIRGMVTDLRPLTLAVGRSMGYAIDIFIDRINAADGPWEKFIDSMDGGSDKIGWLATNARIGGRVITEAFGSLLGLLRALRPAGHDALDWLRNLLITFDDWINSAKGQNAVGDFMDRAATSTKELWNFLDATWDLFTTLIDSGKGAGDTLFGDMADQLDHWTKVLRDNPEILDKWFDDAVSFGRALGNLLTGLGDVADALDNEFSRSLSTGTLNLFADAIRFVADTLRSIADLLGISENKFMSFGGQAAAAAFILPRFSNTILGTNFQLKGLIGNLRNAETRAEAMSTATRGLAGAAGIGLLIDGARRGGNAVGGLENILGGAAAGFAVGGPIGAAVGGVGGAFLTMAQHARSAGNTARESYLKIRKVDAIDAARKSLADLKGTLDQVTGAYTGATRAAALQKLQEAGLISVGQDFNISQRTMIDAALGNKRAMEELYPAVGKVESKIRDLTARQRELANERQRLNNVDLSGDESGALTRQISDRIDAIDKETLALEENKKGLQQNLGVLQQMPGQLRAQGREVRNAAAATADYSGLLHGIPQDVRSAIKADGIVPTTKGVAKYAGMVDDLSRKQVKTLIDATGDTATKKKIDAVMIKLGLLDRQAPKPKVDADPSRAISDIGNVNRMLSDVGGRVVAPKIQVESNVHSIVGDVNYALDHIADEVVNVYTHNAGKRAAGGLTMGPELSLIGEAGQEAIVPLERPLDQIDPAVRHLAAIAQGKAYAGGGVVGSGKTVNVGGMTVVSNSDDPKAVAIEAINHLIGSAY